MKTERKPARVTVVLDLPKGVALTEEGEFVLPEELAPCADLLYATTQKRLTLQRHCEKLEKLESAIKNKVINELPKSQASGIAGKVARVQIEKKPIPQVEDWPVLYGFIKKTSSFELLQRRLNEGAVKERWEADEQVPGVTVFTALKVSCTALKGK